MAELSTIHENNTLPSSAWQEIILENESNPNIRTRLTAGAGGVMYQEIDAGAGEFKSYTTPFITVVSMPLSGIVDASVALVGEMRDIATGLSASYSTAFSATNQHISLEVSAVTGSDDITITGDSISESDGSITLGDTEAITVDEAASYQSSKKWMKISSVTIGGNITAITYDIGVLGYVDNLNRNFNVIGYRADFRSQSSNCDFKLQVIKIKDLGNGKYEKQYLENLGLRSTSSGGEIVDDARGVRDYTTDVPLLPNNANTNFKAADFVTYFDADKRYNCDGTKDEGIIVYVTGEPETGGLSSIEFVTFQLVQQIIEGGA